MTKRALNKFNAKLLLHPAVGDTKPGDLDYFTLRAVLSEHLLPEYSSKDIMLSLLPIAMRMAGPREALCMLLSEETMDVLIFIVGRDHAGPGLDSQGNPLYENMMLRNF